ncbi:MAG TPA: pyruvate carboxylase, partial [Euryarchaeota archaeon]|nr:pyruvate carboxylase [Euryarchaeota archaeon]
IRDEIVKLILGEEKPIDVRPADLLEPMLERAKKELEEKGYLEKEEDVLSYCIFPQVALEFFEHRQKLRRKKSPKRAPTFYDLKGRTIKVKVNGKTYEVTFKDIEIIK